MPRHKHSRADVLSEPAMDISSLIDICFLLLIYFIVSTTIAPRESDLGVNMMDGRPPVVTPTPIRPLLVSIGEEGVIRVGLEPSETLDTDPGSRSLPLLSSRLEIYKDGAQAAGEIPMVRIQADPRCSHQRVTDVLNAMVGVGITAVDLVDDHPE